MANNRIILKRTSTSGRTPNTTGSYATNSQYISAGELALNMADGILYSSNGSAVIEIGSNNTTQNISTNNLTVGNSFYIVANGNLGISTASPRALLSLGNVTAAQKLLMWESGTTRYGFGIQSNELRYFVPANATVGHTFGGISTTDGSTYTEYMRILPSGNVGIGNTAPNARLQVTGTANISGNVVIGGITTFSDNLNISTNNRRISFAPLAGGSNVFFVQQNDDNFVFYSTNTVNQQRAVFSIFANSVSSNLNFSVPLDFSGGNVRFGTTTAIIANGGPGTSGQVLTSNGTTVYWSSAGVGTVTSVATGNGMTGGTITSTGTVSVLANTGIVANATGVFVNAAYINTISSNSATFSTISGGAGVGSTIFNTDGTLISSANQQGGRNYEVHDFDTYPKLYSTIFVNMASSTNVPTGAASGLGYRFIMGAGDTSSRGFDLLGTSINQLWFRERSAGNTSWRKVLSTIDANTGIVANVTGIYVNAAYINTISSNSATFANSSVTNTFTVGTAAYFVANGNVGVGNTTPAEKLQVQGNILLQNGASTANNVRNAGIKLWTDNAFGVDLHHGDTGSGQSLAWATALYGRRSDTVAVRIGAYPASNTSQNTFFEYATVLNSGNFGIGNTNPNARLAVTGTANISGNVVIGGALTSANLTTTTNVATIGTAAYFLANGNVIIGGSATPYKFQIEGSALGATSGNSASLFRAYNNTGNGDALDFLYSRTASSPTNWTTADLIIRRNVDETAGQQQIRFTGDNATTFWTNSNERMRITSGGNVGIGTSSPFGRLEVVGAGSTIADARLRISNPNTSSFSTAVLDLYSNGRSRVEIYGQQDGTGNGGFLILNTSDSAGSLQERMRITSTGAVGIGTSSPSSRFTVSTNTQYTGITLNNGTVNAVEILGSNATTNDGGLIQLLNGGVATTRISGTPDFESYFNTSRNFGIGTSTPTNSKLQIQRSSGQTIGGEIWATEGSYWYQLNSRQSAGAYNPMVANNDHAFIYSDGTSNTGALVIGQWSDLARGIRIDAGGNVGISNSSPNARLHITGTANVSGNVAIGGITTFSGNIVLGSVGLSSNGSFGTAGHVLHSNGTATYWAADDNSGGTVTSVATGNGMTGGTITTTGTVSVLANTGIVANATGVFVNATYIGTISANNASFLGGTAAASYFRSDTGDTFSGGVAEFRNDAGILGSNTGNVNGLQVYQSTAGADAFMTFHINGDFAGHFGIDGTTNDLFVGGWSYGAVKNKVWHAGNDGAGSGLDADTLDGVQGASYQLNSTLSANVATLTSNNANNLGGIAAANYLRTDASKDITESIFIRFGSANQTDVNDGKIGAGLFATGLNIVGTQTAAATGRIVRLYGSVVTNTDYRGPIYYDSDNTAYYTNPAGTSVMNRITLDYVTDAIRFDRAAGNYSYMSWRTSGSNRFDMGIDNVAESGSSAGSDFFINTFNDAGSYIGTALSINRAGAFLFNGTSIRSPIFYDTNNTAYYVDPAGTSVLNTLNPYTVATGSGQFTTALNIAPSTHASSRRAALSLDNWLVLQDSNGNGTKNFSIYSSVAASNRFNIDTSGNVDAAVSYRAPFFYSSSDTNAYWSAGAMVMRSSSPTIYFRDTDHNSAMIHVNSNLFYILRGGNDSTSWTQVDGQWPFYVNLTNNDCVIGRTGTAISDFRAPIFYDSNDTGYYLNPNGTSLLRHTRIFPLTVTNDVWNDSIEIREVNGVTNTQTGSDYAPSIYFHWSNIAAAAIKMYSDGHIRIRAQSVTSTDYRDVYMANLFANIFYDNNNTAFYVDPASTSIINNAQITTLGVGTAASGTTGEIRATNNITAYFSDKRLKDIKSTIPNALDKVMSLSGVLYTSNETAAKYGYKDQSEQVGVIAQEVESVLPQIVKSAPFDTKYVDGQEVSISGENYKTVQYEKLIPLLIEAIKEQQTQIQSLTKEINSLKGVN